MSRDRATHTGVSLGSAFIRQISRRKVSRGAWVRRERTHATQASPIPTTTTSRSRISLAPAAAIISVPRTGGIFCTLFSIGEGVPLLQEGVNEMAVGRLELPS